MFVVLANKTSGASAQIFVFWFNKYLSRLMVRALAIYWSAVPIWSVQQVSSTKLTKSICFPQFGNKATFIISWSLAGKPGCICILGPSFMCCFVHCMEQRGPWTLLVYYSSLTGTLARPLTSNPWTGSFILLVTFQHYEELGLRSMP